MGLIISHAELLIFRQAMDAALLVFHACSLLPRSEQFELKSQWLRSSRSVAANIAEAWRKRYYRPHFLSKLTDVEAEAAECQVWALMAFRCGYISQDTYARINDIYEETLRMAVSMARNANRWTMKKT